MNGSEITVLQDVTNSFVDHDDVDSTVSMVAVESTVVSFGNGVGTKELVISCKTVISASSLKMTPSPSCAFGRAKHC
jgi:hypothetical protein